MAPHFQLRIKSLKFISAVDRGAQGPISNVALIKRAPAGDEIEAVCKVTSLDEKQGLVFGWALATSLDGGQTPHVDLQQDAIVGDDELIKVAAEFMEASAASDVLHDDQPDGKIVFAMPLTKEVNAALGIKSDTHGLAIAMRPSPETFARFVSKELNAFSIGGTGERTEVTKAKPKRKPKPPAEPYKRVGKMAVLTSEVDGHAHAIDLVDPADSWSDTLQTSYQTSKDATESHSHAWVYDTTTGAITIAMDSGHTHTVTAVVPAEVIAEAACDDAAVPCAVEDEPSSGKTIVVAVAARAPVSTPAAEVHTVKTQETSMATDQEKIAELEKTNSRLEKLANMSDAQRVYHGSLRGQEADAFLAKSRHERDIVLSDIEKANEVVYESPVNGSKYRKSDDIRLIEMARSHDEAIAKQRKAEAEAREAVFAKRGDETLTNFAKGAKGDLRGRIMKALNAEFTVPAEYEEAITAMKGMNAAFGDQTRPRGFDGFNGGAEGSPNAALHAAVVKYQSDHKLPSYEQALLKATESDTNIRKLYDAASAAA